MLIFKRPKYSSAGATGDGVGACDAGRTACGFADTGFGDGAGAENATVPVVARSDRHAKTRFTVSSSRSREHKRRTMPQAARTVDCDDVS
jgi:hypothetical protein